jgi:hypothetical protein
MLKVSTYLEYSHHASCLPLLPILNLAMLVILLLVSTLKLFFLPVVWEFSLGCKT